MIDSPSVNKKPVKISRALVSVFDKSGVVELAQEFRVFDFASPWDQKVDPVVLQNVSTEDK